MSGFSFSTPTTTPAATGFGFGQQPQQQSTSFGFGSTPTATATTAANAPGLNFSFGATTTTAQTSFGLAQPQTSFGLTTSTPAASTAAPAFGATAAPSFGATAAPSFGATAAPSFGATAAPSFGATAAPSFGAAGAPSFGAATAPSFGAATPSFGPTTAAPAFGASTTAPSFGTTTTAATTFGAAIAAPAFGASALPTFGASTSAAPSFGISAVAPTLSFAAPITTTTTAPPAFGATLFGAAKPTSQSAPLAFGATTTIATAPTTFSLSAPSTEKPAGLGGLDVNAVQPKTVEGKTDCGKVNQVPNEIIMTVDALKAHIKQQKSLSSDIARNPTRKLFNVSTDIDTLNWKLQELGNNLDANKSSIKLLRYDTANTIQHADMAQRTHDTPAGLQFENMAPLKYFIDTIQKYESDMITFKHEVESTEKHMRSLATQQTFTPQDLKRGLQQMHESFVALAGRLHETHQKVEQQKEQYLNFQKFYNRNTVNPFEAEAGADPQIGQYKSISSGPTPFSTIGNLNLGIKNASNLSQSVSNPWGNISTNTATGGGATFGSGGASTSFNFSSGGTDGGFALQKPPIGTKRNKH